MARCQACQGSCVTSSQERLNTKNWVNTGIIVRATGNVFRCFVSKVTSEISIRYSQIGTGTRTTMHHHSRKIDFLISFHNSDARARLTRFFPGSETKRGAAGRGAVEAEEQTIHREEPRALRQEQGAGVSLRVLVLLREEGEANAGPGLQELQHQQAQEQDSPWKSKFYTIIVCDFQQSIKSGVC